MRIGEHRKKTINRVEKKISNIYRYSDSIYGIEAEVSNSDNGSCSLFLCHQEVDEINAIMNRIENPDAGVTSWALVFAKFIPD